MFGFFGKYTVRKQHESAGVQNSSDRVLNIYSSRFVSLGPGNSANLCQVYIEYDPANGGSAPNKQNLKNSLIAFNSDSRGYFEPDQHITSGSPTTEDPLTFNGQIKRAINFRKHFQWDGVGGTPLSPTRIINFLYVRPELVEVIHSHLGLIAGNESFIPYCINAKYAQVSAGVGVTLRGAFPPKITGILWSGGGTIERKFPASLVQFESYSTGNNILGDALNTLLSDAISLVTLILYQHLFFAANAPVTFSANTTLNLSNNPNLKNIRLSSANIIDITLANTYFDILNLDTMNGLSATKILSLINMTISNPAGIQLSVQGTTKHILKSFVNTDLPSTMTYFRLIGTRITGDIDFSASKTTLVTIALGTTAQLVDGNGIISVGATAGGATVQNGGAGGNGGNNANGSNASSSASNYGGGGGGAGTTGTARNGGNGRQGIIRLNYTTGGVFTQTELTSTGSFSVPGDVSIIFVECWGGGGGGGGRGSAGGASGGGGGAYSADFVVVTPSTNYNYTIGAGGNGGVGAADGSDGGDTYWDAGANVKAAGGKKGLQAGTAVLGGAFADCIGYFINIGGASSVNPTSSQGSGGGGGAGSTGTKQYFKDVDLTGLTNAASFGLSNANIETLELPVNTVCSSLALGGNRLDTTVNTNLISQITAMTGLVNLFLTTDNNFGILGTNESKRQWGQNISGAVFANNLDLSALTVLSSFRVKGHGLTGTIKLPASIVTIILDEENITGIATGTINAMRVVGVVRAPGFDLDFTRLATNLDFIIIDGCGITVVDLTGRTSTSAWGLLTNSGGVLFIMVRNCTSLTTVSFPTAANRIVCTATVQFTIDFSGCTSLSAMSNHENINYSSLTVNVQRQFLVNNCALNIDLKIGINSFLPSGITCQNNAMSIANVDVNLWNIINNRTKWNTTIVAKSINISGTNGIPSGTYAAPTGYRTHAALTVTAVSKANPGVVTVSNIGTVANGDIVYFYNVVGMTELNGNYYKVNNLSGNTFELQTPGGVNVDTSAYGTFTSGSCRPDGDLSAGTDTKAGTYVLVNQYGWTVTQN